MAGRMLVVQVDSTVELPSEPDSGFAGSSSCVSNTSKHTGVCIEVGVLTEISNFNTATPCGSEVCDELAGSEG